MAVLQDTFGNTQEYTTHAFDAAFVDVDGRQLLLDPASAALSITFNLSVPGDYPLTVWLQTPAGTAVAHLLLNTTLTVSVGQPYLPNTVVWLLLTCLHVGQCVHIWVDAKIHEHLSFTVVS